MTRRTIPVLDGIRGLAIIGVLLRHAAYIFHPHGSATRWFLPVMQFGTWGVDLFFVLSGFLITGILLDTKPAVNRARSFYGRRVLRIFPIYYLAVTLVLLGGCYSTWIRTAANLQNIPDHLAYVFYFQNFIPLWHGGTFPESIIGPFWSLAVEEQFYFVWPLIVWRTNSKNLTRICVAALGISLIVRLLLVLRFGSGIWVYSLTPTRADGLFVGSALAAILAFHRKISKRLFVVLAGSGIAALAAVALGGRVNQLWLTGPYMSVIGISGIALACGALITFCLRSENSLLARAFQKQWIRRFGKYSYGMYVWHFPIYYGLHHLFETRFSLRFPVETGVGLAYVALLIGATYAAAWLSFQCFEQWFLRLKAHFEPIFCEPQYQPPPRTVFLIPPVAGTEVRV